MKHLATEEINQHLPELLDELSQGKSLLLEFQGKVIGQLSPLRLPEGPPYRKAGFGKGMFTMSEDFDDPIPGFEPYM